MKGVEAAYHFAGIGGGDVTKLTLRQLWRIAVGKIAQRRQEMFEQANLVSGMEGLDVARYLQFGDMAPTGKGGPPQISSELAEKVEAEVARIKAENPNLPKVVF